MAQPELVLNIFVCLWLVRQRDQATLVVRSGSLVVDSHETITLEVSGGDEGCIDWELTVVYAETMTVSIGVGEKTRLEDGI